MRANLTHSAEHGQPCASGENLFATLRRDQSG
jgi:hypothetical protein